MSLKEVFKKSKKSKKASPSWNVKVNIDIVEHVQLDEYVRADTMEEATEIAKAQLYKRSMKLIHDDAIYNYLYNDQYTIQQIQIDPPKKRKSSITISNSQRKILRMLTKGWYLKYLYPRRWVLINPTGNRSTYSYITTSILSINALFKKGLLINLDAANMTPDEIEVQTALGSLTEAKYYTIDQKVVDKLKLKID